MCGPSCTVDPNVDGATRPHVHSVAEATTPEGFPLHRLPCNNRDLPKPLPRAVNASERRFEVQRHDGRSSTATDRPMLDDPELRMYSSGRIHTMRPADVKPTWQIGRFKGPVNKNEYGLDQPHDIEMDELPRVEPGAYLPKNSCVIDGAGRPNLNRAGSSGARTLSTHRSAHFSDNESVQTVIRRPVAYAPHLRTAKSIDASIELGKASAHFPLPEMSRPCNSPNNFDATFTRYQPRSSGSSPLARSYPPVSLSRYGASTIVSSCEERPFHPALYGLSPTRSESLRHSSSRYRARTSVSSSKGRPFSGRGTDVSSLRRAASVNAASLRLQAFISAFAPGRRLVVTNPDPEEDADADADADAGENENDNEKENEDDDDDDDGNEEKVGDEDYTLRHQQRMALNDIKERLQLINKNCERFRAISYTEPITAQVFVDVDHLLEVKATIDNNNRQHGGSQDEEAAWEDFLRLLGHTECVIEDEITRILANIEAEYGEKAGKAGQQEQQPRKHVRSDTPQDTAKGGSGATSTTTMGSITVDSVPALRTGLARSLSI